MAYYLNKREFFDGALTLFQRDATINSPNSKMSSPNFLCRYFSFSL